MEEKKVKKVAKQAHTQLQAALTTIKRFRKKDDSIQEIKRSLNDLQDANERRQREEAK